MQQRKAAIAAYKEKKPVAGVYAVICTATGEVWVGQSRNLECRKNGLWFALRMGGSPYGAVQAAWLEHGEDHFRFEELDRLSEEGSELGRKDELNRRQSLWAARLRAGTLQGR